MVQAVLQSLIRDCAYHLAACFTVFGRISVLVPAPVVITHGEPAVRQAGACGGLQFGLVAGWLGLAANLLALPGAGAAGHGGGGRAGVAPVVVAGAGSVGRRLAGRCGRFGGGAAAVLAAVLLAAAAPNPASG